MGTPLLRQQRDRRDGDVYTYIIKHYGVPVEVGQRVVHEGKRAGVVVTPEHLDQYVHVRFDGEDWTSRCHPLSLDYGDGITREERQAHANARIDAWNDHLNGRITDDEYRERMARPLEARRPTAEAPVPTKSPRGGHPRMVVTGTRETPRERMERILRTKGRPS